MIVSVEFKDDVRCYKKGSTVTFRPGVNLVVGEQGCGKSTLLHQLSLLGSKRSRDEAKVRLAWDGPAGRVGYFDFEKHNPRVQPSFDMGLGYDTGQQIAAMFASHGEVVNSFFGSFAKIDSNVLLLDEPDAALSPRSVLKLAEALHGVKAPGQVIAAVHNPWLIQAFEHVLSLEHDAWMSSRDFLEQCVPANEPPVRTGPRLVTTKAAPSDDD